MSKDAKSVETPGAYFSVQFYPFKDTVGGMLLILIIFTEENLGQGYDLEFGSAKTKFQKIIWK